MVSSSPLSQDQAGAKLRRSTCHAHRAMTALWPGHTRSHLGQPLMKPGIQSLRLTQNRNARTPEGPLDPPALGLFRLLGVVLNHGVFFLAGVQVAQSIGEPSSVGYLMLSGARNVLKPVREEIKGMVPYFDGGPWRREAHLAGGLHVGQMLEWHRGSEDVVQDPLQALTISGLVDSISDESGEIFLQ